MEKAAAFVLLSLSLTATLLSTGSDACNGVPFVSTAYVCQPAIIGAAMSQLCAGTLGVSTTPYEVTAYVAAAALAAVESYKATRRVANDEMDDPSAPEGLAGACESCLHKYDAALGVLDVVLFDHLQSCKLGGRQPGLHDGRRHHRRLRHCGSARRRELVAVRHDRT
ncbi:hypothetical protein GUJ93_ZPchr0010g9323 [Zizania palustris]|uniref:Pectinesterase inhibitor domain-containing protein n=1 Tax=Zizania palustris TaxID=103762 RepID=A0A8J5WCA6_ZIZPA|nr:hypothetical protein GUJ93_ZPchr0010g9323 [Zizania palustris]